MKLKEIQEIFHNELDELYGTDEVNSFFFMLTEAYYGIDRFTLVIDPEIIITKAQETPLFRALSELKLEKPIQHVLGKAHFFGLEFRVNEHTLIPRPETEELVQWIINEVSKTPKTQPFRMLDIGTGSGCIAIALQKNLPNANVYAIDISEEAIQTAQVNAQLNDVTIQIAQADVLSLENLHVFWENELRFDVIVSNPPYVRHLEKSQMRKNVLDYEPDSALFVSDEKPLIFYEAIADLAKQNLVPNGHLYFEINEYLGKEMIEMLENKGFQEIILRKDIFGVDRMMKCVLM